VARTHAHAEELKATQAEIPWQTISGFRNVIVHDYFGVDLRAIESILVHHIEPLEIACKQMLVQIDKAQEREKPEGFCR